MRLFAGSSMLVHLGVFDFATGIIKKRERVSPSGIIPVLSDALISQEEIVRQLNLISNSVIWSFVISFLNLSKKIAAIPCIISLCIALLAH